MKKVDHMNRQERPKISVYCAMSIDGYIARKDGGLEWLERVHDVDEDYGFKVFMNSIDTIVFGRNTYQIVDSFKEWPYTGKRVVVLSKTLKDVRKEAELFSGELNLLVSNLHDDGVKHIWVDGGITVSKFLETGMVDRIVVTVIPIILGEGIPLFSEMKNEQSCCLVSAQAYPSGIVQLRYDIASTKF